MVLAVVVIAMVVRVGAGSRVAPVLSQWIGIGTALADIGTNRKDDWKKELKFLDLGLECVHAKLVQRVQSPSGQTAKGLRPHVGLIHCGSKTYLFRHSLQVHGIVVRLHAKPYAALERPYPCGLGDLDALDAHASNGKVLVGRRNSVGSHLEVGLDGVEH